MTRIDFYVIPEAEDTGPVLLACRLCEKATTGNHSVFVHVPDAALRNDLDSALWTFEQGSFIAHQQAGADDDALCTVLLGTGNEPPEEQHDVLINLGSEVPDFFSRFERVLEIVHGDQQGRAQARNRFGHYRDRGYSLQTHKL